MDIEKKIELISRAPTEEILTMDELRSLLETKEHPVAYDGFEPSGIAHLASGTMRAIKVQDMLDAGCKFKLLLGDWYAWINNKLGGDLETIKKAAYYLIEVWKASGVDTKKVELVWTSERIKDSEYWKKVISVAKATTLNRMIRCSTIMGRKESEMQYTSQLFYPSMQCADIFDLKADICQLGLDQRKVNILAREIGPKLGYWKPVAVHHHLLMSLQGPEKMGAEILDFTKTKQIINDTKLVLESFVKRRLQVLEEHHFADNIKSSINYVKEKIEDTKEWKRIINSNEEKFYQHPHNLKGFIEEKFSIIVNRISELNTILNSAISQKQKILKPEWDIFNKNFDDLDKFIRNIKNEIGEQIRDYEIDSKMSKSKPMTAIFVHDTPEEIKKKISSAFCPEKQVEENPILEISKYIIFRKTDTLAISRPAKFGGNIEMQGFDELAKTYSEGKLHPMDLKNAVAEELVKILEPVRKYFEKNKEAKELLETIRKANVTR